MRAPLISLIGLFVLSCCAIADDPTWLEIDGVTYGARPDERGPLGGGEGYANIVTGGDYAVSDLDALLEALSKAEAGQMLLRRTPGSAPGTAKKRSSD